jgi:radical SAM protein with 4Fe4S-binding SPASM domain
LRAESAPVTDSEVHAFLEHLFAKGMFDEETQTIPISTTGLRNVYLNVTTNCNLQCVYCYAADRQHCQDQLTDPQCQTLFSDIASHYGRRITVHFTGGEPLLNPEIFHLAELARKTGFGTFLLTNGTLIDAQNVRQVADAFDHIKISLDGANALTNDASRGDGTYIAATRGMDCLLAVGKTFQVSMTVTRLNLPEVAQMARTYGSALTVAPYFPRQKNPELNARLSITGEEYYDALVKSAGMNPYADIGSTIESGQRCQMIQRCSMADGSISIAANGDVYPCHLLHYPEFCAGNILETPFSTIYEESPVLIRLRSHTVNIMDRCPECGLRFLCGGACFARHYAETGSLTTTGDFCAYEQLAIPHALLESHALVHFRFS